MKKNILICLEQLDIGGVETFVYNQAIVLREKGYKVFVLAKKGSYKKLLRKIGVKVINFEFPLLSFINVNSSNKVIKIIKKYKINEVYINQYPCILSVLPACIRCNVPYVSYVHSILFDVFDWFCKTFPIYQELFPIYFSNAYKIITITNETKIKHMKKFNLKSNKYLIVNNSLNFDIFKNKREVSELSTFLIIGRLSEDKYNTIIQSINFYKLYCEITKNRTNLLFLGDGNVKGAIKDYLDQQNITNYIFLGATNNVVPYLEKVDVVLGVDRCILEAIGMKRIAIISGYTGFKGIVTKENISIASKENFSGNNLTNKTYEEVIDDLIKLRQNISNIVENNYNYIKKNLDIKDNTYVINKNINIDYENLYQKLIKISKKYEK